MRRFSLCYSISQILVLLQPFVPLFHTFRGHFERRQQSDSCRKQYIRQSGAPRDLFARCVAIKHTERYLHARGNETRRLPSAVEPRLPRPELQQTQRGTGDQSFRFRQSRRSSTTWEVEGQSHLFRINLGILYMIKTIQYFYRAYIVLRFCPPRRRVCMVCFS